MKKLIGLALVLGVGALLISGCQEAAQVPTEAIPESQIANSIAIVTGMSASADNAVRRVDLSAFGYVSPPSYSDGWWHSTITTTATDGSYSYTADIEFRVWGSAAEAVNNTQLLLLSAGNFADLNQIYLYAVYNITLGSETLTLRMGTNNTNTDSLRYSNLLDVGVLNGPVNYSGRYSGIDYSVTVTYVDTQLTPDGYPYGSANFEVSTNGTVTSGNVVFDGTGSATVNFSGGGSVDVDLFRF